MIWKIERTPATLAASLAAVLSLTAGRAAAQDPSQWTWAGELGLRAESFSRAISGAETSTYNTQGLDLRLNLTGAVVDPQFAAFRLGLDGVFTRNDGLGRAGLRGSRNLGLKSFFKLFTATPYRVDLSYNTGRYDYAAADDGEASVFGLPDSSTVILARLRRISRGPLRGLFFEARRTDIDFVGRQRGTQSTSKEFLDWVRTMWGLTHQIQLSHLATSYGSTGTETDDLTAFLSSNGQLADAWRMNFSAFAIRRSSSNGPAVETRSDTASTRFLLAYTRPNRDSIDLNLAANWGRIEGRPGRRNHSLNLAYRFNNLAQWRIAPNLTYGAASRGDIEIRNPRAGVTVTWRPRSRALETQISVNGSYGKATTTGPGFEFDETTFAYAGSLSIGHGNLMGLRKQVELEYSVNELQTSDEDLELPPGVEVGILIPQAQRRARARLTLARRVGTVTLSGYAERQWTRATTFEESGEDIQSLDTNRFNLTAQYRSLSLTATGGNTDFRGLLPQSSRYHALVGVWVPKPTVRLRTSYREDFRLSDFGPNIDTKRLDAILTLQFGLFYLETRGFQTEYLTEGALPSKNRGFLFRVTRQFGGWLPIRTSTRKGVIR